MGTFNFSVLLNSEFLKTADATAEKSVHRFDYGEQVY